MAKNKMKKFPGNALVPLACTFALIAAALFLTILSSSALPRGRMMMQDDSYYSARLLLSGLNIALCAYLLFVYVRDYLELRSSFTIGLIGFLFAFLLYGLSSFPLLHSYLGYPMQGMGGLGAFALVPMLFSTVALLIFLKISLE